MTNKKFLVSLVAIFAIVFAIANVSATFAEITSVNVNDGSVSDVAVMAGDTLKVRVPFTANENASDVRVKLWLTGAKDNQVVSERFDVYAGKVYSRTVAIQVPYDIEPTEELVLHVAIESRNDGTADSEDFVLSAQRNSYLVDILDVNMDSKVQTGSNLGLNIVLKNRGSHFAEDTFVKVRIPTLGIEENAYFGDLSALDQSNPDKEDAVERRMTIKVPSDAKPGIYTVEIEAYNSDADTLLTRKVVVVGASEESMILSSAQSKAFAVGENGVFTMTLVNSGSKIKVYELTIDNVNENLNVDTDETIIAVPAGTSKTVKMTATAIKAGRYNFAVAVTSGDELVSKQSYVANVQGTSSSSGALSGNTAVVLTVVLAIIFVVLLVVLIVLLTRKPEKQEIGESYY